ncbi:MAG: hypothetical protein HYX27_12280 [Acidobacteria bacterium]|nr:hypothetical protein [Acidobacteriota bacterium]
MLLAASALIVSLLQQIEEASHAEPPVLQVETLLAAARLLPAEKYAVRRMEFLESALRVSAAIRHEPSRYIFVTQAAVLMAKQNAGEARRLCREIPPRQAIRCWSAVDPMEGLRAIEGTTTIESAEQALEALGKLEKASKQKEPERVRKRIAVPVSIKEKMDRADDEALSDHRRSLLFREVLDMSETIEDVTERLMHQGYISAWFAGHREEATAALAAVKLHKTFEEACHCEDAQCDSLEGRTECSENIDTFAQFLKENKIDPAVLAIRHPSLAARALVGKLEEALR